MTNFLNKENTFDLLFYPLFLFTRLKQTHKKRLNNNSYLGERDHVLT